MPLSARACEEVATQKQIMSKYVVTDTFVQATPTSCGAKKFGHIHIVFGTSNCRPSPWNNLLLCFPQIHLLTIFIAGILYNCMYFGFKPHTVLLMILRTEYFSIPTLLQPLKQPLAHVRRSTHLY